VANFLLFQLDGVMNTSKPTVKMMPKFILALCGIALLYPQPAQSFSFLGIVSPFRLFDFLKPSSTRHLSDLLELYDVVQDPDFLESSNEFKSTFREILDGTEVTSEGVVEGKGLVAKRDFSEGEVVTIYPIHALGYIDGRLPPRIHDRSERVYDSYIPGKTIIGKNRDGIIGTSDLVYFEDESYFFGESQDDFSFAMDDPSGKYHFDVNPDRPVVRTTIGEDSLDSGSDLAAEQHNTNQGLFLAHYVNDASFSDFMPVVAASKELMRKQQSMKHGDLPDPKSQDDFVQKGKELEASAAQLAKEYQDSSTGTRENGATATTKEARPEGFNAVMCGFGPPPGMAYVTTRPVLCGEEFLASYGLGYWLGKAFPYDDDDTLDAALEALETDPDVIRSLDRSDEVLEAALDAGDRAVRNSYKEHTTLLTHTLQDLQRRRRRQNRKQNRKRWREKIFRSLGLRARNS